MNDMRVAAYTYGMHTSVSHPAATVLADQIHDWATRRGARVTRQDEAIALVLSGAAYERGATVAEAAATVTAALDRYRNQQMTTS